MAYVDNLSCIKRKLNRAPHTDDHVYVAPDPLGVGGEQVRLGGLEARVLDDGLHLVVDTVQVLNGVDVGHISRV